MTDTIPRLSAGDPTKSIVEALQQNGVVILDGLLNDEVLARFNAELDGPLKAAEADRRLLSPAVEWFMGKHTRHLTGVASKSNVFIEEVLIHPTLLAVCDEVLLPACATYQLNVAHVLDRGPGSEQQLLHRDELVWCHLPRPHPEVQVACIVALCDFTAENGGTRVVPGSHKWPQTREAEPGDIVAAEVPAGSALLYLGSTIHGGGPNTTTSERRRGMHLSYTLGWLRTEENHYLTATPHVVRDFPRRAQELLGYSVHDAIAMGGGYLGAVDTADPVELIAEGRL
jgi:ectoine hydroxylase-related dioxygenase (phytanoyl-CoA dioxygenase family)